MFVVSGWSEPGRCIGKTWKNKSVIRCDVGNPNSRLVVCFIRDFTTQFWELVVQLFDLTIR